MGDTGYFLGRCDADLLVKVIAYAVDADQTTRSHAARERKRTVFPLATIKRLV